MSSEWKNVQERGSRYGILFATKVYKYGGRWLVAPLVYFVVAYFYLSRASTRRHSRLYIERIKKITGADSKPKHLSSFKHYLEFGSSLADRVGIWMDSKNLQNIHIPNQQMLLSACKNAPGATVLTSHLGNFEMCRALTGDGKGIKANIVMDTDHGQAFNDAIQSVDSDIPIHLIPSQSLNAAMAIELKSRLGQGECLFMMADRVSPSTPNRVLNTTLLGGEIQLPEGPFRLAMSLESPIFFMACVKEPDNSFKLVIEPLEDPEQQKLRKKVRMAHLAEAYTRQLEHLARAYPLQWFNFYDYWREEPNKD